MAEDFRILVITDPSDVADEAKMIELMLRSGRVARVHIRKPEWTDCQVAELIHSISADLYSLLSLHGHQVLRDEFPDVGIHLAGRETICDADCRLLSKSCHSISELNEYADKTDYMTLSPIYDSISKSGYRSAFILSDMANVLRGKSVIALGGVTPRHFSELREAGFMGAAMLGFVWNNFTLATLPDFINQVDAALH